MLKKIQTFLLFIFLFTLVACQSDGLIDNDLDPIDENPPEEEPGNDEVIDFEKLSYYAFLNDQNPVVTIKVKDIGIMKAQLFPEVVNLTVNNFLKYVVNDKYTNSTFHRVISNFMIQGGAVSQTYPSIKGEFDSNGVVNPILHGRGVLSMARTIVKNSATSQFFIMHMNSPHLNGEYAAFGGLISGFDVLDQIANVQTNLSDAPLKTIVIESVTVDLKGFEVK